MFVRVSVKFRSREIKPLMFGPFGTKSDDQELLQLGVITELVQKLVDRVNRTSGLVQSENPFDRFKLDVEPREEEDPFLPAIGVHQILVEQYLFQLGESLFAYEPPLPQIDFEKKLTFLESVKKGFVSLGRFLDDIGIEMMRNPNSHTWV